MRILYSICNLFLKSKSFNDKFRKYQLYCLWGLTKSYSSILYCFLGIQTKACVESQIKDLKYHFLKHSVISWNVWSALFIQHRVLPWNPNSSVSDLLLMKILFFCQSTQSQDVTDTWKSYKCLIFFTEKYHHITVQSKISL